MLIVYIILGLVTAAAAVRFFYRAGLITKSKQDETDDK